MLHPKGHPKKADTRTVEKTELIIFHFLTKDSNKNNFLLVPQLHLGSKTSYAANHFPITLCDNKEKGAQKEKKIECFTASPRLMKVVD